jgi:Tfp pilus assembly protein PilO
MSLQLEGFVLVIRRYRYATGCVIAAIVLGAAAWYLWGEVEELEATRLERSREGEAMLAQLVTGSTQRQELAAVREATKRIEENLQGENLAENYQYFYKIEEKTKARLPELHQLNSPPTDTSPLYRRVPYTLRVSGTYEQVLAFLQALETGPKLASVTSFNFSRASSGNVLSLELNLEMLGKK